MLTPVLLARRCGGLRGGRGSSRSWSQISGLGPGPQEHAGDGIEEHQHVLLDPDTGHHPANDLHGDIYRLPRLT
jgi:hypothetical protein